MSNNGVPVREEHCDVAVIGGGIAGLTAAAELPDLNVVVLEADNRAGGRIKSARRGDYFLNLGAQFAEGEGAFIETIERFQIQRGSLVGSHTGLAWGGRTVPTDNPAQMLLKTRLSVMGRIGLARLGLRIGNAYRKAALNKDKEAAHRYRLSLDAQPSTVLASGINNPDVLEIYKGLVQYWVGVEPEEVTAGQVVLFLGSAMVEPSEVPNLSLPVGGNQAVTDALASHLGDRVRLESKVSSVSWNGGGVEILYDSPGGPGKLTARQCVVATRADQALSVLRDIEAPYRDALAAIRYAVFIVAGIFTKETGPQPWDDYYAIATPGLSFQVMFNHAAAIRHGGQREPGGAVVVYAGGTPGRELLPLSDDEIKARYVKDLEGLFPGFSGMIDEFLLQRWDHSIPYWAAGERGGQALLRKPMGPIHLAGDYLGNPSAPAAARAGQSAAQAAAAALAAAAPASTT
jgi:monoamine oxidase